MWCHWPTQESSIFSIWDVFNWGSLAYGRERMKGKSEIYQASRPRLLPASTSASMLTTFSLNSSNTLTFVFDPCFSCFNTSTLVRISLKLSPRQLQVDFRRPLHMHAWRCSSLSFYCSASEWRMEAGSPEIVLLCSEEIWERWYWDDRVSSMT
jgi:hypothetical protein